MSPSSPFKKMKCEIYVLVLSLGAAARGDGYSYPQPPLQFDEPASPPTPIYLPPPPPHDEPQIPPAYPPVGPPPYQEDILPPLDDGIVIPAPPNNPYLPPIARQVPLQVLNMSCVDGRDGTGHFRSVFRSNSQNRFPVMESIAPDCMVVPVGSDEFRVDLEGQKMADCGVRACGVRMCLVLRMAAVPGLRLAEDSVVTLQCIPQETVVSHTKHLRLNAQSEQGRSNPRSVQVASGGNQRRFESMVTLLRKNNGVFDQPVQQGSSVRLGDELLLRTSVRDGDGWKSGRLGSVVIRSASSQRSVVLVDEHGCRNPTMRSVCPQQPQQVTPLTVQLPFRAFLFQGAAPADDLLLSVRMSACLRPRDCYQSKICEDNVRTRSTRAANVSEFFVTDLESQFQFRVLPREVPEPQGGPAWAVISLSVVSVVLGCTLVALIVKPMKERIYL